MIEFGIKDFIDILLVACLLYYLYKLMKMSGSINVFTGILVFILLWLVVSQVLEMKLLGSIFDKLVNVGVLALIIIFQKEIRRFLFTLGSHNHANALVRFFTRGNKKNAIEHDDMVPIVMACMNMAKQKVGALIVIEHQDSFFDGQDNQNVEIELAFQYTEDDVCDIRAFTNNIANHEGGTHEEGFRVSLTRILNNYGRNSNIFKKDEVLTGDDVREGLTAIVTCKISEPQFEGQTKTKLGNTEVRRIVSQAMSEKLDAYLKENPINAKTIVEKSILALRARIAAKKAREATRRKSPLDTLGFASKLADCRTKEPALAEGQTV